MKPLVRQGLVDLWSDQCLYAGADWRSEIITALTRARVAVLLISADFLASDFIAEQELPRLLQGAQDDGARILPVIVSPSRFIDTPLARFQAVNPPDAPLTRMRRANREETLVRVAAAVEQAVRATPGTETNHREIRGESSRAIDPVGLFFPGASAAFVRKVRFKITQAVEVFPDAAAKPLWEAELSGVAGVAAFAVEHREWSFVVVAVATTRQLASGDLTRLIRSGERVLVVLPDEAESAECVSTDVAPIVPYYELSGRVLAGLMGGELGPSGHEGSRA
jgi:hypothetical protein